MKRANAVLKGLLPEGAPLGKIKKACNEESLDVLLEALVADRKVRTPRDEETGEDIGEPKAIFDAKRAAYEVKVIRMYASALGVRPSAQQLKAHKDLAVEEHNYKLLERILALSEESAADNGLTVNLALDALKRFGPDDSRYQRLKETFGEVAFTPEQVTSLYTDCIKEWASRDYNGCEASEMMAISKETGVPLSPEIVQQAYLLMISSGMPLGRFVTFEEVTGKKMPFTAPIVDELEKMAASDPDTLARLDEHLHFCKDKTVAERLHHAALNAGHLDQALSIAEEAGITPDKDIIRERYQQLLQDNEPVKAVQLFEKSNIPFGPSLLQEMYQGLYANFEFEKLLALSKNIGVAPNFAKAVPFVESAHGKMIAEGQALAALDVLDMSKMSAAERAQAVGDVYLHTYAKSTTVEDRVDKMAEERRLRLPAPVQAARASRIFEGAVARIDEAQKKYRTDRRPDLSPLNPQARINVGKYQEYGRFVRSTVEDAVKRITLLGTPVIEAKHVETLYKRCLDLALVQCARGDECVPLAELQKATGTPIDARMFVNALRGYATERRFDTVLQPGLVQRMKAKAGLDFPLTVQDRSLIGCDILFKSKDVLGNVDLPGRLAWLAALDGDKGFNQAFKEGAGNVAAQMLVTADWPVHENLTLYDALVPYAGDQLWSTFNMTKVRDRAAVLFKNGNYRQFEQLQKRAPFELIERKELTAKAIGHLMHGLSTGEFQIYDAYVNEFPFTVPTLDDVREKVIEHVDQTLEHYVRVVEVERRIGKPIVATECEAEGILETLSDYSDYGINPRKLLAAFGVDFQKYKAHVVEEYVGRLTWSADERDLRELKELYQDWGLDLTGSEKPLLDKLLDDSLHDEALAHDVDTTTEARTLRAIKQMVEITKSADGKPTYVPPRAVVDALFAKYNEQRAYEPMLALMQLIDAAPDRALQDELVDGAVGFTCDYAHGRKTEKGGWQSNNVVELLTHRHNYVLAPAQSTRLYDALLAYDSDTAMQYLSVVSSRIADYRRVFNLPAAMDPQRQTGLHEKVKLCALQEPVATINKHTLMLYELTSASTVGSLLTDEAIRAEAAKTSASYLAGEMPVKESFFRGFVYALLTGVTPALTAEQKVLCKQQLAIATGYLRRADQPVVEKKVKEWC